MTADRALQNWTILVTRPRDQSGFLVDALEKHGATVHSIPVVHVQALPDTPEHATVHHSIEGYTSVVFASANAAELFLDQRLRYVADPTWPSHVRVWPVGTATADVLVARGVPVEAVPDRFDAEGLVQAMDSRGWARGSILLPQGVQARPTLAAKLEAAGAQVRILPLYDTVPVPEAAPTLFRLFEAVPVDVVTFASSSAVAAFRGLMASLPTTVVYAAIGHITANTAARLGLECAVVARVATAAGLVDSLVDYAARNPIRAGRSTESGGRST